MTDPPYRDSGDDSGVTPDRESPPGTPRWVKVFGIVALVLVLLFVLMLLTGRGSHGPGRHLRRGDAGVHSPPASVTEPPGGRTPPEGGRR